MSDLRQTIITVVIRTSQGKSEALVGCDPGANLTAAEIEAAIVTLQSMLAKARQ